MSSRGGQIFKTGHIHSSGLIAELDTDRRVHGIQHGVTTIEIGFHEIAPKTQNPMFYCICALVKKRVHCRSLRGTLIVVMEFSDRIQVASLMDFAKNFVPLTESQSQVGQVLPLRISFHLQNPKAKSARYCKVLHLTIDSHGIWSTVMCDPISVLSCQ